MITGTQIRAARALLRWDQRQLAAAAAVAETTIRRAELVDDVPQLHARNLIAIQRALEKAGIVFLAAGEMRPGGEGLRRRD